MATNEKSQTESKPLRPTFRWNAYVYHIHTIADAQLSFGKCRGVMWTFWTVHRNQLNDFQKLFAYLCDDVEMDSMANSKKFNVASFALFHLRKKIVKFLRVIAWNVNWSWANEAIGKHEFKQRNWLQVFIILHSQSTWANFNFESNRLRRFVRPTQVHWFFDHKRFNLFAFAVCVIMAKAMASWKQCAKLVKYAVACALHRLWFVEFPLAISLVQRLSLMKSEIFYYKSISDQINSEKKKKYPIKINVHQRLVKTIIDIELLTANEWHLYRHHFSSIKCLHSITSCI